MARQEQWLLVGKAKGICDEHQSPTTLEHQNVSRLSLLCVSSRRGPTLFWFWHPADSVLKNQYVTLMGNHESILPSQVWPHGTGMK